MEPYERADAPLWIRLSAMLRSWGPLLGVLAVAPAVVWAFSRLRWEAIAEAGPWPAAGLLACAMGNVALSGLAAWVLCRPMNPDPPVSLLRMVGLTAASGLLNLLPARPGWMGRAVLLRTQHGLALRDSLRMLGVTLVLGTLVSGLVILVAVVVPISAQPLVAGAGLLFATVAAGPIAGKLLGREPGMAWLWLPVRVLDLAVSALRLWLAFRLAGHPVSGAETAPLAAAGVWVTLLGLTPQGLGLREWMVAGLTPVLAGAASGAGLEAVLLDRAAELLVLVTTGALGAAATGKAVGKPEKE